MSVIRIIQYIIYNICLHLLFHLYSFIIINFTQSTYALVKHTLFIYMTNGYNTCMENRVPMDFLLLTGKPITTEM